MPRLPHIPPSEQRGLLALAITFLTFCIGVGWLNSHKISEQEAYTSTDTMEFLSDYIDNLQHKSNGSIKEYDNEPFDFNPNTTDSATFVRLGLPYWIAGRIIHYRAAGGYFRRAQDFKKIYGMTDEDYERLKEHIIITP